jgi:hypothetical protein
MRSEEPEEIVFTFHSTHDAIMGERELLDSGIDVRVMPNPRQMGPACGIALRVNPEDFERARELLGQRVAGIFHRVLKSANDTGGIEKDFVPWNP